MATLGGERAGEAGLEDGFDGKGNEGQQGEQ
jgi:hypothetical protein